MYITYCKYISSDISLKGMRNPKKYEILPEICEASQR